MVDAPTKAEAMFNVKLIRPFVTLGVLLALGGCYTNPDAIGPVPYAPTSPILGAAGSPAAGQVVGYAGTTCKAGFYMCQVPAGPIGSQCACPGLGAPSYGLIR